MSLIIMGNSHTLLGKCEIIVQLLWKIVLGVSQKIKHKNIILPENQFQGIYRR
jgi:hypothetical protein